MTDFSTDTLPTDLEPPAAADNTRLPDVYVGLRIPLLAPDDGVVTDRHHASADRYEADDPMNQIGGQISPFTLSGWLRHGCEAVLQRAGATACLAGEAEAHYRQVSSQVRSRNEADSTQPLRQADRDVLGNVSGTWKLTLRALKPEFVGLLLEAVSFLDTHSDEFAFQLGGARNFGAGMADAWVINPLYTETEVRRVFDRGKGATNAMGEKDERWREECRDAFVRALQARLAARDSDLPMPEAQGGADA